MDIEELYKPPFTANDEAAIDLLKRSGLPVALYGATPDVEEGIVNKLKRNGIEPVTNLTGFQKPVRFNEKPVRFNLVIAFVKGYLQADEIRRQFPNVCEIVYLSEIFDMEPVTQQYIETHREGIESLYRRLADQRSKDSLVAYLMSKTRQDMRYLPPVFDKVQYFPSDVIRLGKHEAYFDAGAFTGDTVQDFLHACGGCYDCIWAAEPDKTNYERLLQATKDLPNAHIINKGIYSGNARLTFSAKGSMLSMLSEDAAETVEVDSIDSITEGRRVSYIKYDIEGAELEGLKGAARTIRQYRPTLGVSIYHRQSDLIDIPAYIDTLYPDYDYFFRVHKKLAIDTVLYCIPKENR